MGAFECQDTFLNTERFQNTAFSPSDQIKHSLDALSGQILGPDILSKLEARN